VRSAKERSVAFAVVRRVFLPCLLFVLFTGTAAEMKFCYGLRRCRRDALFFMLEIVMLSRMVQMQCCFALCAPA